MTSTHHITRFPAAWTINESKKHPALVVYGEKALSQKFPLVLVVGREPQADEEVARGIGPYDFTAHPRCAFWNMAYRMVSKSESRPEFNTAALKRECVQRKASPIVFADALPIGLSNWNDDRAKRLQRSGIIEEAIDHHVNGVFELDLMERVRFVILSGHQAPQFQYATNAYRKHLKKAGKPFIETAFFYPTNSGKIEGQIEQANGWTQLGAILTEFCSTT